MVTTRAKNLERHAFVEISLNVLECPLKPDPIKDEKHSGTKNIYRWIQ